jgi:hypothetical protein
MITATICMYYILKQCYYSYQNGVPEVIITIYNDKIEAEKACINNRKNWYSQWESLDEDEDEDLSKPMKSTFLNPYNPNGCVGCDMIIWIEILNVDALDNFPITFDVQVCVTTD